MGLSPPVSTVQPILTLASVGQPMEDAAVSSFPVQMKGTSIFDSMDEKKPGRLLASAGKAFSSKYSVEILPPVEEKGL